MKILIANKFYYNRGGDCIATFALENLLKAHGHEVAIFAMNYGENIDSEWKEYFAPEVNFSAPKFIDKLRAAKRVFYSASVKKQFLRLINDFNPDVVHLNNIHSYISPYIAKLAHNCGIRVVWTQHDYKVVCPAYTLRNKCVCELCFKNPIHVVHQRCIKGSLLQSGCAYGEALFWGKKKLQKYTDLFIAPSNFLKDKLIQGGINEEKIVTIPNCIPRSINDNLYEKEDYYCFVGRFSEEKGVERLLEVAEKLPYRLVMVGDGPMREQMKNSTDAESNITFTGFKQWNDSKEIIGKARFLIGPSEWYEVFGLVSIEAQALGTPVLGANIGGIPETIQLGISGELFKAGDVEDMRIKIINMFAKPFDYGKIATTTRDAFSTETYYNRIINIYNKVNIK